MKCGTYGILPVSRREQNEVDDFSKSTSRLKSTNRDSSSKHTWPIKLVLILITSNRVVHKELCFPTSTSAIYYCLYLKVPFSFNTIQQAICQWSATGGPWAKTGPPAIISGPRLQPDYFDRLYLIDLS